MGFMMNSFLFLLTFCSSQLSGGGCTQRRADDRDPLETLVQQQAVTIQTLQSQLTALQNDVDSIKQKNGRSSVAFTVRFTHDTQTVPHGLLRFDMVEFNAGNGYNVHSGIFTAPVTGIYVFLVNIMVTNDNTSIQVAIDKSGTVLAVTHADSGNGDVWDKGMAHCTVHLTAGDEVWARHNSGTGGLMGSWWTSFSGFLVHAD